MISCPYCKGERTLKRGFRKTQNRGNIQRFYCKECKKRFVVDDGFFRMRNAPNKITASIDMYFRGMSLRKTQEHLDVFYEHNASYVSILNWIVKYSNQVGNYLDENVKIKTSTQLTFDEMEFRTKGKDSFFFDIMDMETRYLIASDYFYRRGFEELKSVLQKAERKSITKPTDVFTDGLKVYPRLLRKTYYMNDNKGNIKHHITTSDSGYFNWKIERLHENVRERTKIMRQFKSLESARAIMRGWEIWYNFCRKHQGINAYPYEKATDLVLGKNKWLDLIGLSSKQND